MKTGGTLNFLKRAGAILMLLAIFASSCNKYADDFKQINTKLDALAGATALSVDVAALKAQITALQTSVAGLPNPTASIATLTTNLATAQKSIDAITASLITLSTSVGANSTAIAKVTTDIKAELTLQLVTVNANIATANTALAAAVLANDAQTAAIQKAILDNNTALAAAIKLQTDALAAQIIALAGTETASNASLTAAVLALQTLVTAQKAILDQLLINTNMVNQDIYIASLTDMRYWLGKLSQIGIINGNVTIITTAPLVANMDSLNMITSRITAVIGTQYFISGGNSVLLKNSVNINSTGTTSAKPLDLSNLYSVVGSYLVTGVDVSDGKLATVGSSLTANYAGVYDFPNLSSVGGTLTLVNVTSSGTSLITKINVPGASATGLSDGINAIGTVSYPKALSIVLGKDVPITTSLTAVSAITVTLGATSFGTVLIDVPACTTLSIAATTVTALTINAAAACVADLSSLGSGALTITGPTTLNLLGAYTSGLLTSTSATTVVLPSHNWLSPSALVAVTNLTLGKVTTNVAAQNYPTLTALSVTGKATTLIGVNGWNALTGSVTTTASNTVLASVTLGGNLSSAVIQNNVKLTSLTAGGIVNSLTIDGNTILAGVTLTNTHFDGGPGSDLTVTNNVALTSLRSSADEAHTIRITGNSLLTSLNLSSYITVLQPNSTVNIVIGPNKLSGTYTAPTAATATTSLIEATIVSADLLTIKDYIAKLALPANSITLTVTADLWDCKPASSGAQSLVSQMVDGSPSYSNQWANSKVDATGGINSYAEFTLVQ